MDFIPKRRWFTAIALPYLEGAARHWNTDAGLLCQGFDKLGVFSRFVAMGEPAERKDLPLILCRPEQMQDPAWWESWKLDGVVLTSWGAPRFEPIARAIKQSGTRLIVRLDSDGVKSPRIGFRRFLALTYFSARSAEIPLAAIYAMLKTVVFRLVPALYDTKVCSHLSHADAIVIESPLAGERMARYVKLLGRADLVSRIRVVPPAISAEIVYDKSVSKARRIIAVGRWKSYQKDAPTLIRVLGRTLADHPDYSATLAGDGGDFLRNLAAKLPLSVQQRITITGNLEHGSLHQEYQRAQIILFTSRYEGFPFAACEALCCGCTVVGAAELVSINYICSYGAGTAAVARSVPDLADALNAEIKAWRDGERDPAHISRWWQDKFAATKVASTMLGFFDDTVADEPVLRSHA